VGARHALFPRLTDIWRPIPPVECHRLPVPRRRAMPAKDDSPAFPAPRRSRPTVSPPPASWVRLLGPTPARLPAFGLRTHEGSAPLRTGRFLRLACPRSASCLRGIVCLERRVLSLTPHIAFLSSDGRFRSRNLPLFRTLLSLPGSSPCQAPSYEWSQSAMSGSLFLPPGCDTGRIVRPFAYRPSAAGSFPTTLAHSSNDRSVTDCVRLLPSTTGRSGA
jgi:hypothetical protein